MAGFFGVQIKYKPLDGRDEMILAPEGANPTMTLREHDVKTCKSQRERSSLYHRRRRFLARIMHGWESASFSPVGSLALSCLAPLSVGRLLTMGLMPNIYRLMKWNMIHAFVPKADNDFHLPVPPEEAATLMSKVIQSEQFSPIVVIFGHGAQSSNNPFSSAYNCGACGGREGGPNARFMARLANDRAVRGYLSRNHGINIPDDTWFIGGLHNTTADIVEYFDVNHIPASQMEMWKEAESTISKALKLNALERCSKFLLASHVKTPEEALDHVKMRANDYAEVRPELNHATNAAVVIGRRDLTKGCFEDRRVFMPSYNPATDDDQGTKLEGVLAPALIVCSGINLEYLFSTVNGIGTKALSLASSIPRRYPHPQTRPSKHQNTKYHHNTMSQKVPSITQLATPPCILALTEWLGFICIGEHPTKH